MATTPATPSNAGATTAAQWKAAADSAYTASTQASVAQLQAKDSLKYANGQVAYANEILNDPTSTAAEKADAQIRLKENTEKQTQAQVALTTATEQKAKAQQSYNESTALAAKNTDPQAASTAAPASTTPDQPPTAYTVTPPDSPVVTSDTKNVTPSDDPSWDSPAEFSGPTKSTPGDSSDFADPQPFTEPTRGTTKVVENTTGGSSTTIVHGQPIETPASQSAQQQYLEAEKRQGLYAADPNTSFGQKTLTSALDRGEITQAQYNEIKNLSEEERDARYSQSLTDQQTALAAKNASQLPGPTTVTRTEEPNTTATTVTEIQPKTAAETTPLSGAIPGTNVSTANVDGTTYQTVANADGTTSYTNENTGTSTTINDATALDKKNVVVDPNLAQAAATSNEAAQDKKIPTETSAAAPAAAIVPKGQKLITEDSAQLAQEAAVAADAEFAAIEAANNNANTNRGTTSALANAQSQASQQDITNFNAKEDWRVKLSLAPNANYLYKVAAGKAGILNPLQTTKGIIFPYTPAISVAYAAQYDPTTLTHTNYKYFTYNSSSVDQITLSCDFTAQDVFEANYLLAVIHFFRSVTKMFYGQDQNPKPGTPPPLCYLTGLGAFQFDNHPIAITNFTYSLPTDVDYIRADNTSTVQTKVNTYSAKINRLGNNNLQSGAGYAPPVWTGAYVVQEPTYVPTKIQISITAVPIVTRNDISNSFSFDRYATGALLRGSERSSGGIW